MTVANLIYRDCRIQPQKLKRNYSGNWHFKGTENTNDEAQQIHPFLQA